MKKIIPLTKFTPKPLVISESQDFLSSPKFRPKLLQVASAPVPPASRAPFTPERVRKSVTKTLEHIVTPRPTLSDELDWLREQFHRTKLTKKMRALGKEEAKITGDCVSLLKVHPPEGKYVLDPNETKSVAFEKLLAALVSDTCTLDPNEFILYGGAALSLLGYPKPNGTADIKDLDFGKPAPQLDLSHSPRLPRLLAAGLVDRTGITRQIKGHTAFDYPIERVIVTTPTVLGDVETKIDESTELHSLRKILVTLRSNLHDTIYRRLKEFGDARIIKLENLIKRLPAKRGGHYAGDVTTIDAIKDLAKSIVGSLATDDSGELIQLDLNSYLEKCNKPPTRKELQSIVETVGRFIDRKHLKRYNKELESSLKSTLEKVRSVKDNNPESLIEATAAVKVLLSNLIKMPREDDIHFLRDMVAQSVLEVVQDGIPGFKDIFTGTAGEATHQGTIEFCAEDNAMQFSIHIMSVEDFQDLKTRSTVVDTFGKPLCFATVSDISHRLLMAGGLLDAKLFRRQDKTQQTLLYCTMVLAADYPKEGSENYISWIRQHPICVKLLGKLRSESLSKELSDYTVTRDDTGKRVLDKAVLEAYPDLKKQPVKTAFEIVESKLKAIRRDIKYSMSPWLGTEGPKGLLAYYRSCLSATHGLLYLLEDEKPV